MSGISSQNIGGGTERKPSDGVHSNHWEDLTTFYSQCRGVGTGSGQLFLQYRARDTDSRTYLAFVILFTIFLVFTLTHDLSAFPYTTVTVPMLLAYAISYVVLVIVIGRDISRKFLKKKDGDISIASVCSSCLRWLRTAIYRICTLFSTHQSNVDRRVYVEMNGSSVDNSGSFSSHRREESDSISYRHQITLMKKFKAKSSSTVAYNYTAIESIDISYTDIFLENVNFYAFVIALDMYLAYLTIVRYENRYADVTLPHADSLEDGLASVTFALPIMMYMLLRCVRFVHCIIALVAILLSHLVLIFHYDLLVSLPRSIFGFVFAMFMLIEYHRQVWHSFQMNRQLGTILDENCRLADEVKANELRHMIGNVAHDLKTPLSSFISGMEVIQKVAADLQYDVCLNQSPATAITIVKDKLYTILEVAENVTNTNAFMIMTINRCIDYNKTLFGLKLSPKPEVFLLKDSLDFTVKCLKNSYDQISIVCEYKSEGLRGGEVMLRTDKQWLQENLLCLVGNAAKYSEKKSTVQVILHIVSSDPCKEALIKEEDNQVSGKEGENIGSSELFSSSTRSKPSSFRWRSRFPSSSGPFEDIDIESGKLPASSDTKCGLIVPSSSLKDNVASMNKKKFLLIEVIDTGKGISEEDQKNLFDEPVQVAREHGGSGLGLYSLAKRVEALGGSCGVSDREDMKRGSRFWLCIPLELVRVDINRHSSLRASMRRICSDEQSGEWLHNARSILGSFSLSTKQRENVNQFSGDITGSLQQLFGNNSIRATQTPHDLDHTLTDNGTVDSDEEHHVNSVKPLPVENDSKRKSSVPFATTNSEDPTRLESSSMESISLPSIHTPNTQILFDRPLQILVVDDSPPVLKLTSLSLRKRGHVVKTAENGKIAVEIFEEEMKKYHAHLMTISSDTVPTTIPQPPFDVILMDFQMPVMDGVHAIQRIRQCEQSWMSPINNILKRSSSLDDASTIIPNTLCPVVIIGFSAKSDEVQIEDAYSNGMTSFLPKPFTIDAFQSILQSV